MDGGQHQHSHSHKGNFIGKWNHFRASVEVGSGWKFFYVLAMPVVWCWIPFVVSNNDKLFGVHLYLFALVSSLFITQAMPLVVTGMIILVLLPLLGLQKAKMAGENVMREQAMLILGQMVLGCAIVICNLHKRIALMILSCTGNAHPRIVTAIYFLTILFSMITSGPAAAFIMLATTQSLSNERENIPQQTEELVDDTEVLNLDSIELSSSQIPESSSDFPEDPPNVPVAIISSEAPLPTESGNLNKDNVQENDLASSEKKVPETEPIPDINDRIRNLDKELKRRYFIIIYIAANIGGLLLPHTSPGVNLLYDYTDSRRREISWGRTNDDKMMITVAAHLKINRNYAEMTVIHWIQFAAPIIFLLGLIAWIYLLILFVIIAPIEPQSDRRLIGKRSQEEAELLREEKSYYKQKLSSIGRVDIHQILVLIFTTCIVILWILRDPRTIDGWNRKIHHTLQNPASKCLTDFLASKEVRVGDSAAVFLFAVVMFMIPRFKNKPSDPKPLAILGWKFLEGQIFWNVVLMFGTQIDQIESGGFRIAVQGLLEKGYKTTWIVVGGVAIASELFGGVAISNILLYILSQKRTVILKPKATMKIVNVLYTSKIIGVGHLALPVTAISSLSFMFPAATASNAIVFSLGTLTGCLGMLDMVTYGAFLDLMAWLLVSGRYEIYTKFGI